jgi:hypothetical protein
MASGETQGLAIAALALIALSALHAVHLTSPRHHPAH